MLTYTQPQKQQLTLFDLEPGTFPGSGALSHFTEVTINYSTPFASNARPQITCSTDCARILRQVWFRPLEHVECFYMLLLNRANRLLGYSLISLGGIAGTTADPKVMFQVALKTNASAIILAHNHPSGNPQPSPNDVTLTQKAKQAGELLDITVLDHLILLPGTGYYSFADERKL